MLYSVAEQLHPVNILAPAADAAGRTGAWVNTAYAAKVSVRVHVTQGNAATILLSLLQATAAAGTGSKAGPTAQIWANLDTATNDTLVRVATDAATYTTDAGVKLKIVVFEFDASALDVANGFSYITVSTGASNAANITSVSVEFLGGRYQQATPPSVVV